LKEFLNRFGVQVVRLNTKDKAMTVHAFTKRVLSGPFSDSLIRYCPKMFCEIKRRAMAHIVAEDWVTEKRSSVGPIRPRATGRPQPMRVHEVTKEKKATGKQQSFETWKPQTRGRTREDVPPKYSFRVELKELIAIPNIVERMTKGWGPSRTLSVNSTKPMAMPYTTTCH